MSIKQIEAHEKKHRKGNYRGKGWNDDFDAMCAKTVMRRLIGKWGLMSIDYQQANTQTLAAAEAIAKGQFDDEDIMPVDYAIDDDGVITELTDEEKQNIIEQTIKETSVE
jgi:recombination protein RecT